MSARTKPGAAPARKVSETDEPAGRRVIRAGRDVGPDVESVQPVEAPRAPQAAKPTTEPAATSPAKHTSTPQTLPRNPGQAFGVADRRVIGRRRVSGQLTRPPVSLPQDPATPASDPPGAGSRRSAGLAGPGPVTIGRAGAP